MKRPYVPKCELCGDFGSFLAPGGDPKDTTWPGIMRNQLPCGCAAGKEALVFIRTMAEPSKYRDGRALDSPIPWEFSMPKDQIEAWGLPPAWFVEPRHSVEHAAA